MPSELQKIVVRTTDENIIKMKTIAKFKQRSVSRETESIIEKHIAEFEQIHGEIDIYNMNVDEIVEDLKDRIKKRPPYGDK